MTRQRTWTGHLLAALIAFGLLIGIAIVQNQSQGLLIEVYGVDTLFVLDAIFRISAGEIPHSDFTLHLGALPFAMISAMSETVVEGAIRAQWVLAVCLVIAGLWIGATRLSAWATALLLVGVVLVATALSTAFDPRITLALFYNRWAWAIALVFIVAIAIEPEDGASLWIDNLVIAALAMALLTTKITLFAGLVTVGVIHFAAARRWKDIATIAGFCVAVAGVVALNVGWSFWVDYLDNLVWVATNPLRQTPGQTMLGALTDNRFLAIYIAYALFILLIAISQGLKKAAVFALLGLALLFIQVQNFGQVPVWAIAMAAIALTEYSRTPTRQRAGFALIGAAFILALLPTLFPLASSSFRNAANDVAGAPPIMPGIDALAGMAVTEAQAGVIEERELPLTPDSPPHMSTCLVTSGFIRVFKAVADKLQPLEGPVFIADATSPYWMQNGTAPLRGAALWNYGSLRGLENAGIVAVPTCPFKPSYQRAILTRMAEEGIVLTPIDESRWVTVMTWSRE